MKWLDNLLSLHAVPGVRRSRRGVERRISDDGLIAVEFCRILNLELGVSMARAAEFTRTAMAEVDDVLRVATPSGLLLSLPIEPMRRRLVSEMTVAVDSVARAPRGRPAAKHRDAG